jgi:hypothetical protein
MMEMALLDTRHSIRLLDVAIKRSDKHRSKNYQNESNESSKIHTVIYSIIVQFLIDKYTV